MSPPIVDGGQLVNEFAGGATYPVERFSGGSYVQGVYAPTGESTFNITAIVIPAGGEQLLKLPEGERTKETFLLLSTTELKAGVDAGAADRVTLPRGVFEVKTIDDFTLAAGFYRYLVQRVDLGD